MEEGQERKGEEKTFQHDAAISPRKKGSPRCGKARENGGGEERNIVQKGRQSLLCEGINAEGIRLWN